MMKQENRKWKVKLGEKDGEGKQKAKQDKLEKLKRLNTGPPAWPTKTLNTHNPNIVGANL